MTVLDEQVMDYEEDIKVLQTNIETNQKQADELQAQVDAVQKELDALNENSWQSMMRIAFACVPYTYRAVTILLLLF